MTTIKMPTSPVRTRIAPSPTGDPHVGTAYIALFNKALAVKTGGRFLLRIEDTDRARYVAGSEQMIFDALRWLALDYDEGPDVGGPHAPYRQSERAHIYKDAVENLLSRKQAYRCFCAPARLEQVRKEMEAKKIQPRYDGLCKSLADDQVRAKLAAGEPSVVRMIVPTDGKTTFEDGLRGVLEFDNSTIDDQVLMKSDGLPTYHLANVVDDHEMAITHVIRAEEWISSTPKHVLLYGAFGWQAPVFCHMPLLRNADKTKISKRKNPTSLNWYRDEGFLPEALLNFLGLMGYSMSDQREIFTKEEFIADFDISRVKTSGPVFDLKKLEWLNGEWLRRIPPDDFARRIVARFGQSYGANPDLVLKLAPLIQGRIKKLTEWPDHADSFFKGCPDYPATDLQGKLSPENARAVLDRALAFVRDRDFSPKPLEEAGRAAAKELGLKDGDAFMVLRIAISGKKVSPPLFESMVVLGRDESLARLEKARTKLP